MDPQKMNEASIMPRYDWFAKKDIDIDIIPAKIRAMQKLGVPYEEGYDERAVDDLMAQAQLVADDLKASGIEIEPGKQMVAMIAYMHKLGRDISTPLIAENSMAGDEAEQSTDQETKPIELLTGDADLAAGKEIYNSVCAVCHKMDGSGIPPAFPSLIDGEWINGNSPAQVYKSIAEGNVAKGMIAYKSQYSEKQLTQLTSYILLSLNKK